jgi:hypothetical protein
VAVLVLLVAILASVAREGNLEPAAASIEPSP